MIGFDMINRRTHLYAGLFFLPWFLFYGLSSGVFNHPTWFDNSPLKMTPLFDRPYGIVPPDGDVRAWVTKALQDNGLDGPFAVQSDADKTIHIFVNRFLSNTNLVYNPKTQRISAERGYPTAHALFTRVHTRAEYSPYQGFLRNFWAFIVDLVQVSILIWILSGLYMWWHLKRFRGWGWLAVGSGVVLFGAFLAGL